MITFKYELNFSRGMKRVGRSRRKTRHKLKKSVRERGKVSITKFLQEFSQGDKVCLKAEPAYQKGMYFPRFHGSVGIVQRKRGSCYEVLIKDSGKEKLVIVHPVHLQKVLE